MLHDMSDGCELAMAMASISCSVGLGDMFAGMEPGP
jgi:hypothetical protein